MVAACGGTSAPDPNASATTTTAPIVTPTTSVTSEVKAEPTGTPSTTMTATPAPAKVVYDVDGADGIRRMVKWSGPVPGEVIGSKKAWAVVPNMLVENSTKRSFEMQTIEFVDVLSADAKEVVFEINKEKYAVPAALARAGGTKGLKKGAAARCNSERNALIGIVTSVDKKSVKCKVRFLSATQEINLTPEEVLPLFPEKHSFGTPLVVRSSNAAGSRHEGIALVENGAEHFAIFERGFPDYSNHETGSVFKVSTSNIQPIDPAKFLKVGDTCLARQIQLVVPCKVTKVIDGGFAYEVQFEDKLGSPEKEWTLGMVLRSDPSPQRIGF